MCYSTVIRRMGELPLYSPEEVIDIGGIEEDGRRGRSLADVAPLRELSGPSL